MADPNPYKSPTSNSGPVEGDDVSADSTYDDWQAQGKLVVLATFDNAPEAHCLRIELENNGIRAAVANETSAQTVGASLFGRISAVWVEVVVLSRDAEKALVVKNEFLAGINDTAIVEWKCKCGETVDAGFAQCWSCMEPHPDAV